MKRIHIHVGVEKLDESIRFYSALFGAEPVKIKADYAKWMLDDPRVNFAISDTGRAPGIDHLGIQAESGEALAAAREELPHSRLRGDREPPHPHARQRLRACDSLRARARAGRAQRRAAPRLRLDLVAAVAHP